VRRLRRGLTVLERDKLRAEILERQMRLAVTRAAEYGLTGMCREAMRLAEAGERSGALHRSCGAEEPGGLGCLCPCHDVRDTAVAAGSAPGS
jgi:hypothetical protein